MKITVTSTINVNNILKERGLGPDKKAQRYLANRVRLRCMPYTPRQSGILSNTSHISSNGDAVVWEQPYAHYQYYGQVMGGRAPKHYTGKALSYSGGPMRGPQWDKRMMADHRGDIENDLAAYMGGKK